MRYMILRPSQEPGTLWRVVWEGDDRGLAKAMMDKEVSTFGEDYSRLIEYRQIR